MEAIKHITLLALIPLILLGGYKTLKTSNPQQPNSQIAHDEYSVYRIQDVEGYYFFTRDDIFVDDVIYWGIMDDLNNITIPDKFVSISFIPMYDGNIVEVRTPSGKVGLYTLDGKQILPPEYDAFYPIYNEDLIAYYKKGNRYGFVKRPSAGPNSKYSAYTKSPLENKTIMKWNFPSIATYIYDDNENPIIFFPTFYSSKGPIWFDYETSGPIYSYEFQDYVNGVYILSSYKEDEMPEETFYFITKYDTTTTKMHYFITRVCDLGEFVIGYKKVSDTVIRLKNPFRIEYWIVKNGQVKKAEYPGKFPQVIYEPITLESLQIAKLIKKESNGLEWTEFYQKYYSPATLDTMRNEIFAYHGYKFKKPGWYNYFSKQKWYHPKSDKVKLTPLEQQNVQRLLKLKKYLQEHKELYKPVECKDYAVG